MEGYRKKVAICGSRGFGSYLARAILETGEWELVILSRNSQPDLTASGIKVKPVDYSSVDSLYHVIKRQQVDTVISVIPDAEVQLNIIDACLMAGVRRFVPAEFETSPEQRPLYVSGDKMSVLARLEQVSTQLEYTAFSCGLFMETFAPGGWSEASNSYNYSWNDGSFLLDLKHKKALLPVDNAGSLETVICLTSAVDVARFVAAALFLRSWQPEMKMFGDRLRLRELLEVAQYVRAREFKVKVIPEDDIEFQILRTPDWKTQRELQTMRNILGHEYNIDKRYLNAKFPDIRAITFEDFLRQYWRASTH
ncbi:hypothetical protein TWF106_002059 [Orbilia oligospora]|uniref:NmrA-like domain-containing protein n=1 Tax=Orbilia oligospora TaxID=2813651 RepID=A0A6G1MNS8_ORBOL|nr:hypothetical protein TWF788_004112 [Orbilia oligospora]KAF3203109.1 hypothetical protein TWF106_002059 [Orbilia oligospora]KAF3213312.1 hypothetical protein TWF191_010073 [Orbilia oligospora]KAF3221334.1 hypothetical protein TWF679_008027 [Orbilia oligospora]KAF3262563.1 hypothetical protein TWF192_007234 [Orbilia oligospora]